MPRGADFAQHKTYIAGETITASDRNADSSTILNNLDGSGVGSYYQNAAEMIATSDPYPGGTEAVPANLLTWQQQIQYQVLAILQALDSSITKWVEDAPLAGTIAFAIRDQSRGLIIKPNASFPAYQVDLDADELTLQDTSNIPRRPTLVDLTADFTTNGINGCPRESKTGTASSSGTAVTGSSTLFTTEYAVGDVIWFDTSSVGRRITNIADDTNLTIESSLTASSQNISRGGEAPNTFYNTWVWSKADGTKGMTLDTSNTAPIVPTDYIYKGWFGTSVYSDSSSDVLAFEQEGNRIFYDANQTIKDGSFTTGAWTAQDVRSFFPPTAKKIEVAFGFSGVGRAGLSPRSDGHAGSYLDVGTGTGTTFGGIFPTLRNWINMKIRYEDTVYYWVDNAGATLSALGWEY